MVPHVYGGVGIVAGHSSVTKPLFIRSIDREGAAYLVVTAVVAGSALGIYNQGGFGVAHYLAVLTLTVAFGGFILERLNLLGRFSVYFQAIAYSAITLFHMIPAITDFLRRLPARVPFIDLSTYRLIDSFDFPVLEAVHLVFLGLYVVGVAVQILKIQLRVAEL